MRSWAEIQKAYAMNSIRDMPKEGDRFPVSLCGGNAETIVFQSSYDDNGNLYFISEDCLLECEPMNSVSAHWDGWREMSLRRFLNDKVFSWLPQDLQEVIAPCHIVQVLNGERVECDDKLFCFSLTQVFGENKRRHKNEPEDTRINLFRKPKNRVRQCGDNADCLVPWWTRSPVTTEENCFNVVYESIYEGGLGCAYATSREVGVCFGFCLRKENEEGFEHEKNHLPG